MIPSFLKASSKTDQAASSPAREALIAVEVDIAAARGAIDDAEAAVARLGSIVASEGPAAREKTEAVHRDGGVALARLATGAEEPELSKILAKAHAATVAADAARAALPVAEQALGNAKTRLTALEMKKRQTIGAVLIEVGDVLARQYLRAFDELAARHDELAAFSRGSTLDVLMADTPLEAPRFNLPALRADGREGFSTYLRHVGDDRAISAGSRAWRQFVARLAADPLAQFDPSAVEGAPDPARMLSLNRRRSEDTRTVDQIVFAAR